MENIVTKIKISVHELKSRMEELEGRISELEIEERKLHKPNNKEIIDLKRKKTLMELTGTYEIIIIMIFNISIIGVTKGEERRE